MNVEQYFIGQILLDNSIIMQTSVKPWYFTSAFCRDAFKTVQKMLADNTTADITTLPFYDTRFKPSEVAVLTTEVLPSNWQHYEKQIIEAYRMRNIRKACETIQKDKLMDSAAASSLLMNTLDTQEHFGDFTIASSEEFIPAAMESIQQAYQRQCDLVGISTGLEDLNYITLGFQKRRMYVFGARPSQGKTALMINFLASAGVPAGVISAESSQIELGKRLFSLKGRISSMRLNSGSLKPDEYSKITDIAEELKKQKIFIYDEPNVHIDTLVMKAREMKRLYGIEILFIDYLQQIQSTNREKRNEQVAEVSSRLKHLARTLDIPVVALAQLRRDSENKRPVLSDIGDSGQIERDADFASAIYQQVIENEKHKEIRHWLLTLKNRDGVLGDIEVVYIPKFYQFADKAREVINV